MTAPCRHGEHVGDVVYGLVMDLSYSRAQIQAWRTMCFRLQDVARQREQRLALLDGTLDRRYLRAWEERRRLWEEECWAAGRSAFEAARQAEAGRAA
jgi:hypothetical protein